MMLFAILVTIILIGLLSLANNKAKILDEENIKLRLENNVLKSEVKDLRIQLKSYIDCPEQLWQV